MRGLLSGVVLFAVGLCACGSELNPQPEPPGGDPVTTSGAATGTTGSASGSTTSGASTGVTGTTTASGVGGAPATSTVGAGGSVGTGGAGGAGGSGGSPAGDAGSADAGRDASGDVSADGGTGPIDGAGDARDGGGGSGGAGGSSGMDGGTSDACSKCSGSEGCIVVQVTRTASDTNMPWVLFPGQADGKGTFTVAAAGGSTAFTAVRIPNTDLTNPSASFEVAVGCFAAASNVRVCPYLDDDDMVTSQCSANFRDTCPVGDRQPGAMAVAGMRTVIAVQMGVSCD